MYEYLGNTGISTYDFMIMLGVLALLVYNYSNFNKKCDFLSSLSKCFLRRCSFRKHKITSKLKFWVVIEILVISVGQYGLAGTFNTTFGNRFGTGPNYYGLLFGIPVVLFLLFYIISINPFKQMDLITPAFPLALVFSKLGCFLWGCCEGFECSWGLYFPSWDSTLFPTQLVEVGIAVLLFVFLLNYKKNAKEGTLFPIYLIAYSILRFIVEFTSGRFAEFGIFNIYHIICAVGVVIGFIELFVVNKYADKIKDIYELGYFWDSSKNRIKRIKRK